MYELLPCRACTWPFFFVFRHAGHRLDATFAHGAFQDEDSLSILLHIRHICQIRHLEVRLHVTEEGVELLGHIRSTYV